MYSSQTEGTTIGVLLWPPPNPPLWQVYGHPFLCHSWPTIPPETLDHTESAATDKSLPQTKAEQGQPRVQGLCWSLLMYVDCQTWWWLITEELFSHRSSRQTPAIKLPIWIQITCFKLLCCFHAKWKQDNQAMYWGGIYKPVNYCLSIYCVPMCQQWLPTAMGVAPYAQYDNEDEHNSGRWFFKICPVSIAQPPDLWCEKEKKNDEEWLEMQQDSNYSNLLCLTHLHTFYNWIFITHKCVCACVCGR